MVDEKERDLDGRIYFQRCALAELQKQFEAKHGSDPLREAYRVEKHHRERLSAIWVPYQEAMTELREANSKLTRERDEARKEHALLLNTVEGRCMTDACSGEWETCWCDTCEARRKRGEHETKGGGE